MKWATSNPGSCRVVFVRTRSARRSNFCSSWSCALAPYVVCYCRCIYCIMCTHNAVGYVQESTCQGAQAGASCSGLIAEVPRVWRLGDRTFDCCSVLCLLLPSGHLGNSLLCHDSSLCSGGKEKAFCGCEWCPAPWGQIWVKGICPSSISQPPNCKRSCAGRAGWGRPVDWS